MHIEAVKTVRFSASAIAAAMLAVACFAAALLPAAPSADTALQRSADRAMTGRPGALVVMDVVPGAILAAHDLDTAKQRPARPGSTLKPFVLNALLESGKLDPNQHILCRCKFRIG